MAARIFVSYRRSDAAGDAGRLADHLQRRFGKKRLFLDIDTIEPGTNFVKVLQRALKNTVAMLVVIGPRWVSAMNEQGERRLHDPEDFVRRELEAALPSGIPVIPVLVQGAAMPTAAELPGSLSDLATRQAVTLGHAAFHADAERLCSHLATIIIEEDDLSSWVRRHWRAAVVAAFAVAVLVGLVWVLPPSPNAAPVVPVEDPRVEQLINEASQQQKRLQFPEALAHWTLFENPEAVAAATKLFETALSAGRARAAVRDMQWAAYDNSGTPAADAERLKVASAMRREEAALSEDQESALWGSYYSASLAGKDDMRNALLDALPPDEHIETIQWAFRERTARSWADGRSKRFWVALLTAKAGRLEAARTELERLKAELERHPGSLRDAVHRALASL